MSVMKSTIVAGIMGVALVGVSLSAVADRHGPGKGRHFFGTLTDKQRTAIMTSKVNFLKKKMVMKGSIKKLKAEIAVMMTSGSPNTGAISAKVDQILKIKKQKIMLKIKHKLAVRKILNAKQRVMFDMYLLKKSMKGKRRCKRYHGRRGHWRGMGRGHRRGGYGHHRGMMHR